MISSNFVGNVSNVSDPPKKAALDVALDRLMSIVDVLSEKIDTLDDILTCKTEKAERLRVDLESSQAVTTIFNICDFLMGKNDELDNLIGRLEQVIDKFKLL